MSAFTIIEILVVLGIISVILGMTTVYIFNFKSAAAMQLEAQKIVASMNRARSLAITNQAAYKVYFDKDAGTYVVRDASDNDLDVVQRLPQSISFDLIKYAADNTASFNSTGGIERGSVILKNNKDRYVTIKTLNVTGRIRVLNYQDLSDD